MSKIESLIITCDQEGFITEVICNSLLEFPQDISGKHFTDIVDSESKSKAKDFIKIINMEKSVFNYEMNIELKGKIKSLSWGGLKYKGQILITTNNEHTILKDLFEEISSINNEQSNIIRKLSQKAEGSSSNENIDMENNAFNKISQLNNELINMQRELARLNRELKEKSIRDPLTGLYNRGYFYEKIPEELARASRLNYGMVVASVDINNFKSVNDNYGHEAGDRLLKDFCEILKSSLRKNFDSIFRFGGDEFLILLVNCSEDKAEGILKKINNKLINKSNNEVSISYGIVKLPIEKDININEYLKIADDSMYKFKKEYKKQGL